MGNQLDTAMSPIDHLAIILTVIAFRIASRISWTDFERGRLHNLQLEENSSVEKHFRHEGGRATKAIQGDQAGFGPGLG